jgi:hypothetical protein
LGSTKRNSNNSRASLSDKRVVTDIGASDQKKMFVDQNTSTACNRSNKDTPTTPSNIHSSVIDASKRDASIAPYFSESDDEESDEEDIDDNLIESIAEMVMSDQRIRPVLSGERPQKPPVKKPMIAPPAEVEPIITDASDTQNEEDLCKICFSRNIVTACVPCGHSVMCVTCSRELNEKNGCPLCRSEITQILRIRK